MERFVSFHMRIENVLGSQWVIKHGKSSWLFNLPEENAQFTAQILALTDYASKTTSIR